MASFEPGDVIAVPYPYTDRPVRQRRPALVVSGASFQAEQGLIWVVMITSAENRGWKGDIALAGLARAGLPAPSIIRPRKIATVEARDAERLGAVSGEVLGKVLTEIRRVLELGAK
ncbi:MAG: type II toxin-antitoxin system PemK/MazF family toxin [Alphaproteobacteria bacterium]|nr:type II toxin-antitoxin system PemK/MazF family toxin [Alphaproteobacteria bacterium]